jgi:Ser/Thr protein kinase RdoA (MazF antagonist)
MNGVEPERGGNPFQELNPDRILTLAEKALGCPFTNLFRPLNSYINRVYELQNSAGDGVIIKFYRPGRWSKSAILEEHRFLLDLNSAEIPVIPPLKHVDGGTLGVSHSLPFALFPKCGGRSCDEFTDDQWLELGRLLGRTHLVGMKGGADQRVTMVPDQSTKGHLDYILKSGLLEQDQERSFRELGVRLINEIGPFFKDIQLMRIHGDCHFSNIIHRPGESFFLIDFDDMVIGPPVQDFWMLLPGYSEDSFVEIDIFLEGYETFMNFDRRSLRLIEPLRVMRYLHYMAWCAHQVLDDGETLVVPDFGTRMYWQTEMQEIEDQLVRIQDVPTGYGNC